MRAVGDEGGERIFGGGDVNYSVIYYERENGESPVREFIQQFETLTEKPAVYARLELLEEYGPQLKRPYADYVRDKIYELRFKLSRKQIRILYFIHDKTVVLTNGLIKKTKQIPENEIKRAIGYRRDYFVRHGEKS